MEARRRSRTLSAIPKRSHNLVLWGTYVRGSDYYTATSYMRAVKAVTGVAMEDWDFFTATLGYWAVGFQDAERAQALMVAFRTGLSPQMYMKAIEASESVDVTAMLQQVSAPTLVIQDGSVLSVPAAAKSLASAIPSAQLVSVRGTAEAARATFDFTAAKSQLPPSMGVRPGESAFRTVLFTDLVNHTDMMQRLGDARGRDVLREHERITRDTLKQHGGVEIKTDGDSFMVSFASVGSALDCAVALQCAFANYNETAPEPIAVRMGLNAGEPIEEDGDLFGSTVILASRIAAIASTGEILVPDTVRGLLSGKGFVFGDRGEFVPKGFDEGVRLWDVRWRE